MIDPTAPAREAADEHHFIRPGGDAALLFGLLHVLFEEGLTDPVPHLAGLDEVEALARDFAPEAVTAACGIEAQDIRRMARELAAAPRAAGASRDLHAGVRRARELARGRLERRDRQPRPRGRGDVHARRSRPAQLLRRAGGRAAASRWAAGPRGCISSPRATANYSPAVLPANGTRQEWEVLAALTGIVTGQGADADIDAIDDFVIETLAKREVGGRDEAELLAELQGRRGPERMLDLLLRTGPYELTLAQLEESPHGLDLGPLEPRLPDLLRTPSGEVELAPERLVADVPRLRDSLGATGNGMVLVGRRQLRSNNSWMHNLEPLVKGREACTAQSIPTMPAGWACPTARRQCSGPARARSPSRSRSLTP